MAERAFRPATHIPGGYLQTTYYFGPDDWTGYATAYCDSVLIWMYRGSGTLLVDGQYCHLAVGHGWWVPASTVHRMAVGADSLLGCTHFDPEVYPEGVGGLQFMKVPLVLRELLMHLGETIMDRELRLHAQRFVPQLVTAADGPAVTVPMPLDPRIAPIAHAIADSPGDNRDLEEWAQEFAISSRSIARCFRAELNMTFFELADAGADVSCGPTGKLMCCLLGVRLCRIDDEIQPHSPLI